MVDDDRDLLVSARLEKGINLYEVNSSYDALRVDVLQISVICGLNSYFSF